MREPTTTAAHLEAAHREPRIVVGLIFPSGSIYLTNRTGLSNVPGNVVAGALSDLSSSSQTLRPDDARSTIGTLSFTAVDIAADLTSELRSQLLNGNGLRGREVRVWTGDTDDFNDYERVETYVIDRTVSLDGRSYRFSCSDRTREQRVSIFERAATRLDASLTESATTVTVLSTSGFEMVAHTASFSDAPSSTVGYFLIKKTGEVCRYTGKTATTFTGVTRAVFGTIAAAVEIAGGTAEDKRPEIEEFIYLEMPAPQLDYAVKTGKIKGTANTLPATWHMGIAEASLDGDSYDAIGTDLYDPSDVTEGLILRFAYLEKIDGKKFAEEQIHYPAGTFVQTTADGLLRIRRLSGLLSGASPLRTLSAADVINHSEIKFDLSRVTNRARIFWNWNGSQFTRETFLLNQTSIDAHGESPLRDIKLYGLHVSRHTAATIRRIFDTIADRYGAPPIELTARLSRRHNALEIADAIRLALPGVQDFTGPATLNRTFEIQSRRINWRTGRLDVQLFGSTSKGVGSAAGGSGSYLADSWYTSTGTNLTSPLTISAGAVTANGTITGGSDARTAVFYYDGDLTINAGVTVTITGNVQLRIKGTLTVNGSIDGIENGLPAPSDPNVESGAYQGWPDWYANGGYLGSTHGGSGLFHTGAFVRNVVSAKAIGTTPAAARLSLEIAGDGSSLSGLPSELRGTPGMYGQPVVASNNLNYRVGGAGGDSGAGLLLICRGLAFGASGEVDLSGGDGSPPTGGSISLGGVPVDVYAGGGAGGAPGAFFVLLDGDDVVYPDLSTSFIADHGAPSYLGTPGEERYFGGSLSFPSDPGCGLEIPSGAVDMWESAHLIQRIPRPAEFGDSDDELVPPPTNLAGAADGAGAMMTWENPPVSRFDYVELWSSVDNDRSNATLLYRGRGESFFRSLETISTRWHWVRAARQGVGFSDWYPVSSTAGVEVTFGGTASILPAPFAPGMVGGACDFVFSLNTAAGGGADNGELRIVGLNFDHPDGTPRTLSDTDTECQSPYGDALAGRIFVMWSDTNVKTRFSSLSWFPGQSEDVCFVRYNPATGNWEALSNAVAYESFTPVATDCIIAACTAPEPGNTGFNELEIFTGGTAGEAGSTGPQGDPGADGFTALPADFSPGLLGGSGDFLFTLNENNSGAADNGEIRVQGQTFFHPDGVLRTQTQADSTLSTPYDSTSSNGPFWLMWTDTAAATRFSTLTFVGVYPHNIVPVRYVDGVGWRAFDNAGTLETFTPVATDSLLAVVEAESTTGLSRIAILISGMRGAGANGFVLNGDFEAGSILGWETTRAGTILGSSARTGTYGLNLPNGAGGPNQRTRHYAAPAVGRRIAVEAWARRSEGTTPGSNQSLALRWFDSSDSFLSTDTVDLADNGISGWQHLAGEATVPDSAAFVEVSLGEGTGVGYFDWDNVSANIVGTDGGAAHGAIINGGFETGDFSFFASAGGTLQSATVHSGNYAVEVDVDGSPECRTDIYPVEAGQLVKCSAYVQRNESNLPGDIQSLIVYWYTGGSPHGSQPFNGLDTALTGTSGWQTMAGQAQAPAGADGFAVAGGSAFPGTGGGSFFWDDFGAIIAGNDGADGADGIAHGPTINKDPFFENWETHWFANNSGAPIDTSAFELVSASLVPEGATALHHTAAALDQAFSERFPISPDHSYIVEFAVVQSGTPDHHIAMQFFDGSGALITSGTSDAVGWTSISSNHYMRYLGQQFPTTWTVRSFRIGRGGEATIPSNAKTALLLWAANTNAETEDSYVNYLRIKEFWPGVVELPATFSPGLVGGEDDFRLVPNWSSGGANDGEIMVVGKSFEHPDGSRRHLTVSRDFIFTPFGEGKPGKFFLMWTDTAPWSRFGATEADWGHPNICPVAYADESLGWYAQQNAAGTRYYFTPTATDVIIAAGVAWGSTGGIDELIKLTNSLKNPESAQAGIIFKETFDGYLDEDDFLRSWEEETAGAAISFSNTGVFGGGVLSVDGDTFRIGHRELIPWDPGALYKMTARVRCSANGTGGTEEVYVGLLGVAADGETLVNRTGADSWSSQHYVVFSIEQLTTSDGWQERAVYLQGLSASGGENFSAEALSPLGPLQLDEDVRFVRPLILGNFQGNTNADWEFDYIIIEKVLDPARDTLTDDPFVYDPTYGRYWEDDTQGIGGNVSIGSGENGNALYLQPDSSGDIGVENIQKSEVVNGDVVCARWRFTRSGAGDFISVTNGSFFVRVGIRVYDLSGTLLNEQSVAYGNGSALASAVPTALTYVSMEARFPIAGLSPSSDRMYVRVYAEIDNTSYTGSETGTIRFDSLMLIRQASQIIYTGFVDANASSEFVPYPWSVTNPNTGDYTVTHNLGLSSPYDDLTVTLGVDEGTIAGTKIIQMYNVGANSFSVKIWTAAGGDSNEDWYFHAIYDPWKSP